MRSERRAAGQPATNNSKIRSPQKIITNRTKYNKTGFSSTVIDDELASKIKHIYEGPKP